MQRTQVCDVVDNQTPAPPPAVSPINKLKGQVRPALLRWMSHLPAGLSTRLRYLCQMRRLPSFRRPQTLTEWMNHLKLYDRTPLRAVFADRVGVRDYVASRAPACRLVPIIGTFDALTPEIWDALPEAFVLKATHGSGMLHLCRIKSRESFEAARAATEQWLARDFGGLTNEWVYDAVPRRIVAEAFLDDGRGAPPADYKFFCFGGRVGMVQVDMDRFGRHVRNLYTPQFIRIPAEMHGCPGGADVARPAAFDTAVAIAERLSREIDFVRVDLYLVGKDVYFGEMTCFPCSGFGAFKPQQIDRDLGALLSAVRVVRKWTRAVHPGDAYIGAVGEMGATGRIKPRPHALGSAVDTEWA